MSEIPVYSVVDKSKKRQPVQHGEDTLPHDHRKELLKKKPLPLAAAYRKNDSLDLKNDAHEVKSTAEISLSDNIDLNPTENSSKDVSDEEHKYVQFMSSSKFLKPAMLLLLIMICMMVLTGVFALSVLAVASDSGMKSEIKALQEQLQTLQQNFSEEYNILRENDDKLRQIDDELSQNYSSFQGGIQQLLSDNCPNLIISSCASLPPSCPSGHYLLATSTSAARVYCDMTRTCGNITGGWRRVGYLNMTDNSSHCPVGLRQRMDDGIRTCGGNNINCSSVVYNMIANLEYSRVCGRVRAYQVGSTNGFRRSHLFSSSANVDSAYVDGISLTHGDPRQHIWTLAAALDNEPNSETQNYCPCQTSEARLPPMFVGNDYFCDSGSGNFIRTQQPQLYGADPLWDGAGCEPPNTCCSFNTPPWFYKQLSQPTTDDIEMRVCRDEASSNEDIAIVEVEIYIQ